MPLENYVPCFPPPQKGRKKGRKRKAAFVLNPKYLWGDTLSSPILAAYTTRNWQLDCRVLHQWLHQLHQSLADAQTLLASELT